MNARNWLLGLRRGLTALLLLLIFVLFTVTFLLHTEKGTAFVLQRALAMAPLDLTIERSSGALADGLKLHGLKYRSEPVDVSVGTVDLDLAFWSLLGAQLHIRSIALADTTVRIAPGEQPREPRPLTVPRLSAPIPIRIDALSAVRSAIVTQDTLVIERVNAALGWTGTEVSIGQLEVAAGWTVNARGAITLDDPVPVDLTFDWTLPAQDIQGSGRLSESLAELALEHQLGGAYRLSSRGTLNVLNRIVPTADLTHECDADCGAPGVELTGFTLHHSGTLDDSAIQAQATAARTPLPPTKIVLSGQWRDRSLTIESASARGDAIDLDAEGNVSLAPSLAFDVSSTVRRLDAAVLSPTLSGSVAGSVKVNGTAADQFSAVLKQLTGDLNGYALTGTANVVRRGQRIELKPVQLSIGDNALTAAGTMDARKLALTFDARLPDLSQVEPRLAGALNASGKVAGTLDKPRGEMLVNGTTLQFNGVALGALDGAASIDKDGIVDGKFEATGLVAGERDLGRAAIQLGGSFEALEVAAGWLLPDTSLDTLMTLRRTPQGFRSNVREARLQVETLGTWAIEAPFAVHVDGRVARVDAHTWRNGDAYMQVNDTVIGKDIVMNARLADMPLQTFAPLLPAAARLSGAIDATVALARDDRGWQGDVQWRQRKTLLRLAHGKTQRRLALPTFSINGTLDGQSIAVNADIRGDYGLSVYGELKMTGAGVVEDPAIEGILAATLPELGWLGPWVDGLSEVAGNGAANLDLRGTVAKPTLRGVIALNDAALSLDDAGLRIEELALLGEAREGQTIELAGRAVSGGGKLTLSGRLDRPWDESRRVELNIKGSDVQAFNARDYRVWVSPDLNLSVTATGATVSGEVAIPRADIRVKEVPENVVRTSSDIRVEGRVAKQGIALPINGDITLRLGEQVHLFALGLDTDLRGDLELSIAEGRDPFFNGRIYLEDGRFKAYGQDLTVDRGNVFYAGPVDNPVLDFRATRAIQEGDATVTAGVRVTGPAQAPSIDVFAEPAMSETEALSYLILGRSSLSATGDEGESLSQAALAFGLSRSSPLTTQLAGGLGLDELTVAGNSVETAELVAGKQVSDRLYVRYSFGVFSNLGAILLRYRLSERLALEAGSADSHSLDVLYTIEK